MMLEFHIYAFACAVIGYVIAEILTAPGEILNNLWVLTIGKLPEHFSKPLGGCAKCTSGQLALWYYLLKPNCDYNTFNHIYFVSLSILIAWVLQKKVSN